MEFKHDQTSSNTIKQGGQTVKSLITKQCLMMFGRQTFPVWPGLKMVFSVGQLLRNEFAIHDAFFQQPLFREDICRKGMLEAIVHHLRKGDTTLKTLCATALFKVRM